MSHPWISAYDTPLVNMKEVQTKIKEYKVQQVKSKHAQSEHTQVALSKAKKVMGVEGQEESKE